METTRTGLLRVWIAISATLLLAAPLAFSQAGGYGGIGGFGGGSGAVLPGGGGSGVPSIRPWISASGSYVKDIATLTSSGIDFGARSRYTGGTIAGGLNGDKAFEHGSLSGGYIVAGNFGNYSATKGVSQVGSLGFNKQLTQQSWMSVQQMGGSSYGGYGYGGGLAGLGGQAPFGDFGFGSVPTLPGVGPGGSQNPGDNGIVDGEVFDNRVNFYSANGTYGYSFSQRLSVAGSVGGGIVRRDSPLLVDLNNAGASGQVNYQVSERFSIGGFYNYGTFTYPGQFGGNQMQSAGVSLAYLLTRKSSLSLYAGGYRFHSDFVGQVAVPPELAEILGISTVLEVQQVTRYGPNVGASYHFKPRVGNVVVSYTRGVNPGNGLLRASTRESFLGTFSVGRNRLSGGVTFLHQRLAGITDFGGRTKQTQVYGSISTRIYKGLHFTLASGYRFLEYGTVPDRNQVFATAGLSWTPSAYPIGF